MEENYLQITGKAYLEYPLEVGKEYSVAFKAVTVYGSDVRDGQGEGDKVTYKAKSTDIVTVVGERVIQGKPKKGSMSQKLRAVLNEYYDQQLAGDYSDFESFYNEEMGKIIEYYKSKLTPTIKKVINNQ